MNRPPTENVSVGAAGQALQPSAPMPGNIPEQSAGSTRSSFLRSQESSVRHLQQLYTIVSGLALSDVISTVFRNESGQEVGLPALALLVAFVVTLVPFFHGAMRHLDEAYLLDESAGHVKPGALAVDFVFLFIEGVILFLLAHWLLNPERFLVAAVALLVTDMVWAVPYTLLAPETQRASAQLRALVRAPRDSEIAQLRWVRNNALFTVILLVAIWPAGALWLDLESQYFALLLAAVLVARSTRDYWRSWEFYFPHSVGVGSMAKKQDEPE